MAKVDGHRAHGPATRAKDTRSATRFKSGKFGAHIAHRSAVFVRLDVLGHSADEPGGGGLNCEHIAGCNGREKRAGCYALSEGGVWSTTCSSPAAAARVKEGKERRERR